MAVYRVQRTRDYTVMSNYHLKDKGLTLKSKGLLSMILSLPEEWNYTTRGLASICKEGVDAIGSALKELETAGYIVRRQLRGANGRITDTEYIIYEQPQPKKLDMLPSDVVSPDTENPDTGGQRRFPPLRLSGCGWGQSRSDRSVYQADQKNHAGTAEKFCPAKAQTGTACP